MNIIIIIIESRILLVYMCTYINMYLQIRTYKCICINAYAIAYINLHIYIYIYISVNLSTFSTSGSFRIICHVRPFLTDWKLKQKTAFSVSLKSQSVSCEFSLKNRPALSVETDWKLKAVRKCCFWFQFSVRKERS